MFSGVDKFTLLLLFMSSAMVVSGVTFLLSVVLDWGVAGVNDDWRNPDAVGRSIIPLFVSSPPLSPTANWGSLLVAVTMSSEKCPWLGGGGGV